MADDKKRCGAKCRDGSPCKNYGMANGRCRMHGGKSLKGTASKTYKSGLYSKYAGESLASVLDELEGMEPEQLTRVDNELKLMTALIAKSKALENDTGDLDDLNTISMVLERLIKSKQRAVALRIEENRLVPIEDMQQFLKWMRELLYRKIKRDKANEILAELENFKITESCD